MRKALFQRKLIHEPLPQKDCWVVPQLRDHFADLKVATNNSSPLGVPGLGLYKLERRNNGRKGTSRPYFSIAARVPRRLRQRWIN